MKLLFAEYWSACIEGPAGSAKQPVATYKLSNVYETLVSSKFEAHTSLEDIKALGKIIFTVPLQFPNETLVSHLKCTSPNDTFDQVTLP